MAISRAQLLKELLPGLNALFGIEYATYGEQHKEIYETETSERSFEEETKLSGFSAAPVKNEGSAIAYDNAQEAFTARYNHETIALGFSLTEEAIEDNLYDSLSARYTKGLARAMAYTKQVKAAAVLNNGFSSAFPGGDGVSLVNTAHPIATGTFSNQLSTAANLSQTSLEQILIQIRNAVDNNGKRIRLTPKKIVSGPSNVFQAEVLLKSVLRAGTANNDVNPVQSLGLLSDGQANLSRITSTTAWWVQTDAPEGLKLAMRRGLEKSMEGDFETDSMRYKATERYAFGWTDPRGVFGTAGI